MVLETAMVLAFAKNAVWLSFFQPWNLSPISAEQGAKKMLSSSVDAFGNSSLTSYPTYMVVTEHNIRYYHRHTHVTSSLPSTSPWCSRAINNRYIHGHEL